MTHIDAAGNELEVGDLVLTTVSGYRSRRGELHKRKIVGFKPKMVELRAFDSNYTNLVMPNTIVKLPDTIENVSYEYGIHCIHNEDMQDPLRTGMETAQEAFKWIQDFADDCGPGNRIKEVYYVIRKPQGKWEKV